MGRDWSVEAAAPEADECAEIRYQMVQWRALALVTLAVAALLAVWACGAMVRRRLIAQRRPAPTRSPIKPLYNPFLGERLDREDDLSDSISDTSSLFSPPFRSQEGVAFKSAAADVSHTQAYLPPSVSTENFNRLVYDTYDSGDDLTAEPKQPPPPPQQQPSQQQAPSPHLHQQHGGAVRAAARGSQRRSERDARDVA
jgi:hypothetical protein